MTDASTRWTGLHHVRIPVADLGDAAAFWESVLGYEREFEFPGESGPLGLALRNEHGAPNIVLWRAPDRATAMSGFTVLGIGVADLGELEAIRDRLDEAGVTHAGIQPAFVGAKLPGVETPGGALVGFYVKPGATVARARP